MYRLQVWFEKHWKWGVKSYESIEVAQKRVEELKKVGIKARVMRSAELFN